MINENKRLDLAFAALDVLGQPGTNADRLVAAMRAINGIVLTGASDAVREEIESFGLNYNSTIRRHPSASSDGPQKLDEADASELVLHLKQVCELIRDSETQRILKRLRQHGGVLPEAEVIEARRHRDWFVPRFMQECRDVIEKLSQLDDCDGRLPEDQRSSIPFFSLFLFSEWHVIDSVPIILEGLQLGGECPFELFGDAVHEQVPRYLAQFLPSDLDRIDELIRDSSVNLYVRWAAAGSYKFLVRDQNVSPDDAVARLDRLFHHTKTVGDDGRPGSGHCYELSSGILETIYTIGGASSSTVFADDQNWNFVDQSVFNPVDAGVPARIAEDSELTVELLRLPPTRLEDCLKKLRNWAAFRPVSKPVQRPVAARPSVSTRPVPRRTVQNAPPSTSKPARPAERVSRNARCPCGSGKKYKQCCLRKDS